MTKASFRSWQKMRAEGKAKQKFISGFLEPPDEKFLEDQPFLCPVQKNRMPRRHVINFWNNGGGIDRKMAHTHERRY